MTTGRPGWSGVCSNKAPADAMIFRPEYWLGGDQVATTEVANSQRELGSGEGQPTEPANIRTALSADAIARALLENLSDAQQPLGLRPAPTGTWPSPTRFATG